ncbi:MAG TPA: hypothetical protein VKA28_00485 [Candidatus Bathyarchaeia archaeon]|nr:hypothetical protein [Candidatus Bathyarchaeia archaeon]
MQLKLPAQLPRVTTVSIMIKIIRTRIMMIMKPQTTIQQLTSNSTTPTRTRQIQTRHNPAFAEWLECPRFSCF